MASGFQNVELVERGINPPPPPQKKIPMAVGLDKSERTCVLGKGLFLDRRSILERTFTQLRELFVKRLKVWLEDNFREVPTMTV